MSTQSPRPGDGPSLSPLETAIQDQDSGALRALIAADPELLHRQGYWAHSRRHNHYRPLEYAVTHGKPQATQLLLEAGSRADDRTLRAASYADANIPIMELLLRSGADVNSTTTQSGRPYPLIFGPSNTLPPRMLELLICRGAHPVTEHGSALALVLANNNRDAGRKSACLNVLEQAGLALPDSAPMAAHRSRTDLLQAQLDRDPGTLARRYAEEEIYPPELGIELPPVYAFVTPLRGVTLLHMAIEWGDPDLARWLLDQGADVDAPAQISSDGFGSWTPLYHAMVSLRVPRSQTDLVSLLLDRGADVNVTASIRKPLPKQNATIPYAEFRDVTPLKYAREFVDPDLVNQAAVQAVGAAISGTQ